MILTSLLAYRPFIDPINAHAAWWALLLPLALGIALAYKAVRVRNMRGYPRAVLSMFIQIVVAMVLLGLGAFIIIQLIAPALVPMDL